MLLNNQNHARLLELHWFFFQPIADISKAIRSLTKSHSSQNIPRILVHTDAAQTIGKVKVDVDELGVDYLTVVGHKFYGPRIGMAQEWCYGIIPRGSVYMASSQIFLTLIHLLKC